MENSLRNTIVSHTVRKVLILQYRVLFKSASNPNKQSNGILVLTPHTPYYIIYNNLKSKELQRCCNYFYYYVFSMNNKLGSLSSIVYRSNKITLNIYAFLFSFGFESIIECCMLYECTQSFETVYLFISSWKFRSQMNSFVGQ